MSSQRLSPPLAVCVAIVLAIVSIKLIVRERDASHRQVRSIHPITLPVPSVGITPLEETTGGVQAP